MRFYTWGVAAANKLKQYDKMLDRMELSKAHATLRSSLRQPSSADAAAIEREFDAVCRNIDESYAKLGAAELDQLKVRRRMLWDLVAINRSRASAAAEVPAFSLQALQHVLEPDEAVVYYYWLHSSTLLIVTIDRNEIVPSEPLMPLGQTENEVLAIGEAYLRMGIPVTILTGCEAIEERLIELQRTDQLPRYTCLHFATHATDVQGDTPMESHVFLRNSRLEGLEIATWRLNADLVVLSACHSGQRAIAGRGMDELPGDELFGLQAAFFAAGARCVVGNLWPVDDVVSSHMMIRFHQYLLEGQPPECALQKAVLDHLQESTCLTRKVFFWAPFFIAGMGRAVSADTSSAVH